jgi:hypothetical protein
MAVDFIEKDFCSAGCRLVSIEEKNFIRKLNYTFNMPEASKLSYLFY